MKKVFTMTKDNPPKPAPTSPYFRYSVRPIMHMIAAMSRPPKKSKMAIAFNTLATALKFVTKSPAARIGNLKSNARFISL